MRSNWTTILTLSFEPALLHLVEVGDRVASQGCCRRRDRPARSSRPRRRPARAWRLGLRRRPAGLRAPSRVGRATADGRRRPVSDALRVITSAPPTHAASSTKPISPSTISRVRRLPVRAAGAPAGVGSAPALPRLRWRGGGDGGRELIACGCGRPRRRPDRCHRQRIVDGGGRVEAEDVVADLEYIARPQVLGHHALAVDEYAVGAAQVEDDIIGTVTPDLGVVARDAFVGEHDTVIWATPKRARRVAERELLARRAGRVPR